VVQDFWHFGNSLKQFTRSAYARCVTLTHALSPALASKLAVVGSNAPPINSCRKIPATTSTSLSGFGDSAPAFFFSFFLFFPTSDEKTVSVAPHRTVTVAVGVLF